MEVLSKQTLADTYIPRLEAEEKAELVSENEGEDFNLWRRDCWKVKWES